jgi:dipeptidase D
MKSSALPNTPAHLWQHFSEIAKIPRPSGKEQAVRDYIVELAKSQHLDYVVDEAGNLVVYVPASPGYEGAQTVAIQNHLDMVTVKTEDKEHNFDTDPIELQVIGRWLTADRTTLGADNGIGVAAALAVLTDTSTVHPRLELVFTVEEETGLYGALGFNADHLSATRMINLDTEEWGEIFVGCAGGYGYKAKRDFRSESVDSTLKPYTIKLNGLSGGHSGLQIHQQLGNANKLLADFLTENSDLIWALAEFRGGIAHNVIPPAASVVVYIDPAQEGKWRYRMENATQRWLTFLPDADNQLAWHFKPMTEAPNKVLSASDRDLLLSLISILPHGAQSYSYTQPADLVNLSCNLAVVNFQSGELLVQTSIRFFNKNEAVSLKYKIESVFKLFGMDVETILDYPSWNPNFDSPLVERTAIISQKITGQPAKLRAIHAGLECGILTSKKPDMDVVSFGPTILGAHSPTERLEIATVEPFWEMLQALLAELAVV